VDDASRAPPRANQHQHRVAADGRGPLVRRPLVDPGPLFGAEAGDERCFSLFVPRLRRLLRVAPLPVALPAPARVGGAGGGFGAAGLVADDLPDDALGQDQLHVFGGGRRFEGDQEDVHHQEAGEGLPGRPRLRLDRGVGAIRPPHHLHRQHDQPRVRRHLRQLDGDGGQEPHRNLRQLHSGDELYKVSRNSKESGKLIASTHG
jgi:hypothetical protein